MIDAYGTEIVSKQYNPHAERRMPLEKYIRLVEGAGAGALYPLGNEITLEALGVLPHIREPHPDTPDENLGATNGLPSLVGQIVAGAVDASAITHRHSWDVIVEAEPAGGATTGSPDVGLTIWRVGSGDFPHMPVEPPLNVPGPAQE